MRCYGVATRGIVLGDRGDVDDARAFSDLLRCPKSLSQCLIVRCRPSDGRASPFVVEVSGNRKRPMPAVQYIQWSSIKYAIGRTTRSRLPAARIAIMRKSENSSCVKCQSVVPIFVLSAVRRFQARASGPPASLTSPSSSRGRKISARGQSATRTVRRATRTGLPSSHFRGRSSAASFAPCVTGQA